MSSSTFSFDRLTSWRRLPPATRRWHGLLLCATVAVIGCCMHILGSTFWSPRWRVGDASVLCIGTSRMQRGVEPDVIPWPTGKMTFPALDLATAAAALTAHEDLWPKLQVVLVELDEFTLLGDSVWTHQDNMSELCGNLAIHALETPSRNGDLGRSLRRIQNLLSGNGLPALHHSRRFTIENCLPATQTKPATGARRTSPTPTHAAARLRIKYAREKLFGARPYESAKLYNAPALAELAARLRQRGVAIVLLAPPCHPAYEEERPTAWDEVVDRAVADVRMASGFPDIPFWDFRGDPRFSGADFADVDHLGREGAERWSRMLAGQIRRDVLRDRSSGPR